MSVAKLGKFIFNNSRFLIALPWPSFLWSSVPKDKIRQHPLVWPEGSLQPVPTQHSSISMTKCLLNTLNVTTFSVPGVLLWYPLTEAIHRKITLTSNERQGLNCCASHDWILLLAMLHLSLHFSFSCFLKETLGWLWTALGFSQWSLFTPPWRKRNYSSVGRFGTRNQVCSPQPFLFSILWI